QSPSFSRDFVTGSTADDTTFSTGSKDILDITPGWQCAHSNNVGNKVDIANAYAVAYTETGSGDRIFYFGLERTSNNGDANIGFWFLQDSTVGCSSTSGTQAFTGHHQVGDIFVVSAFTNGGVVSNITVYLW